MAVSFAGSGVRVNAVSPGWIDTRDMNTILSGETIGFPPLTESDHSQHPAGCVGVPEDIKKIVEFLVDDVNGFITGQVIYRVVLFIWLYMQKFFSVFLSFFRTLLSMVA
jgi:NAD(P)-dependent dehydrogenase (short-subunit alcohol dehydrogenase family)